MKRRNNTLALILVTFTVGASIGAGCAAKTAATANRDITTVIAGAGAAANQAETQYNNKTLAQNDTNRKVINDLGAAYNEARGAFIAYLQAQSAYQAAENQQMTICAPANSGGGTATSCSVATATAQNNATAAATAKTALDIAVSQLAAKTQQVQTLK